MRNAIWGFAGALLLATAPIAVAQTSGPPATSAPESTTTTTTTTTTPAPVAPPATPAPAPAASMPPASATSISEASCRTRRAVDAACACKKDPSRVGAAQADPDGGKNICVVP